MDLSKTLQEYFSELSSNSPTPGGGNVAAMCGALSASLGIMVCNLTIGKKKYADVEPDMIALKQHLETYQKKFFELGEKDNLAFNKVMESFKLPKETTEEIDLRSKAIEEATLGAADVPTQVMQSAKEMIPLIQFVIEKGNKNSLSDAGVASALIDAACKGAYLNVIINCNSLSNQIIAEEIKKRADILLDETWQASYSLLDKVNSAIKAQ